MELQSKQYDVIVVGAGHAGCEAALATARLGCKTLMLATNLDTVAFLACNPSVGGTAKGQIVKEIDALGGEMAVNADKSLLQMRMLNRGKGPAVYSPRAQVDKNKYHTAMKQTVEHTPNLFLRQGEATDVSVNADGTFSVTTAVALTYTAKAVVLWCGVYLNSRTIVGACVKNSGPNGFANAEHLTDSLVKLGFTVRRFKTGTPARVRLESIDLAKTVEQCGEEDTEPFSYLDDAIPATKRSCYLTYTTAETKQIVLDNKELCPVYNFSISGVLVDDITTKETEEPYRMMTSRAEHRLVLRQDNADLRLTEIGREIGLVSDERYNRYLRKKQQFEACNATLSTIVSPKVYSSLFEEKGEVVTGAGMTLDEMMRRPGIKAKDLRTLGFFVDIDDDVLGELEIECKYRGYIDKERESIEQARKLENRLLPPDIDYMAIDGLRIEARQKLDKIRPANLGQAGRISGVSPADVQILIVYLSTRK